MSDTLVAVPPAGWSIAESPFHAGELAAQERVGVRERMDVNARRGIRDYVPEQHRIFFAEQPFMVLGGVDTAGQPWATLRIGEPGFVSTPDEHTLRIAGRSLNGDPLAGTWKVGSLLGGLGIQPATRRRNRVNGVVTAIDEHAITVAVSQSYGNCAKYIQSRTPSPMDFDTQARDDEAPVISDHLSDADRQLISSADTFFIASADTSEDAGYGRGADVSHRGGKPGFIRIDDNRTLTTPDFSGNLFFNTIGNLLRDPRAGLLVIDFVSGDLLYLAVDAEVIWEGKELESFDGAERLIRWRVREVRRTRRALPLRWSDVQYAPQLVKTGSWTKTPSAWRKLKVSEVREEAPGIKSFYFEPADDMPLPPYEPGQFLPIRLDIPGHAGPVTRTYTLSDAYDARRYRITVKREGVASTWLHEHIEAGAFLEAKAPSGAFVLDRTNIRPIVFVSAGIGITPMIAMLKSIVGDPNERSGLEHIYFIHGARDVNEHPFADELHAATKASPRVSVHLRESRAVNASTAGRVDIAYLRSVLPFGDYDFYLCGPAAFMRDLYSGLRALNVADDRIRFEAFGPASVKRDKGLINLMPIVPERLAKVVFKRSQKTVQWSPEDGSLLELAEANGVEVASNCRSGVCGTCSTRIISGDITYPVPCEGEAEAGMALLCSAIPAKAGKGEESTVEIDA
ncbi:pyridoxamine 5'-phosphate oxidase [Caballeronia sordidicola]|uniref:Pyridoxamine 5'-phosphate oxidase n=1 Tax=Caballeronia sordidicola TaxID=196367 RepID=A0A158HCL0_CABSO|nr:pyridoxamine 5'-phosphate oxidase [Caballeronia sordidicola]